MISLVVMPYLTMAAMIALVGLALTAAVILAASQILVHPPRMTDGRAMAILKRLSPADLGLEFQDFTFDIRDEQTGASLRMAGWWIRNPRGDDRCAIVLHGYGDAKIGAIAWAPLLQRMGFHVLAVDLRAHGESQGAATTAGYFERHDLSQIIDQLRSLHPKQTARLILLGVSLGAAVAAATAAIRDDLAAVVLESPYIDFYRAVRSHANITGLLGPWVARQVLKSAERATDADYAAVAPIRSIQKATAPILIISSGDDPFVTPEDQQRWSAAAMERNARIPTRFWHAADSFHVLGMRDNPEEYARQIAEFLSLAGVDAPAPATT
jgi:uncharacterized protein